MVDSSPEHHRWQRETFDDLYEDNYADVYRYAVRRCASVQDAEDLVAETFAVAWRRLAELPVGNEARLWLFGTARLLRMNQHRSTSRREALAGRLRAVRSRLAAPDIATSAVERERIRRALENLSDPEREVLLLVAWEGLSPSEVATVLDITPAAARKRLERARTRFRQELPEPTHTPRPSTAMTAREAGR